MSRLNKLVKAKQNRLVSTALSSGGIDKDAWESYDRLSKLEAAANSPRRWVLPALAFALLTVSVVLMLVHLGKADVELDLVVNELHFRLPAGQRVVEDLFLRRLNASEIQGVEIDGEYWAAPPGSSCFVRIELASSSTKEDSITIPGLTVPQNWDLGVSRSGSEISLEFTGPAVAAEAGFSVRAALRGQAWLYTDCNPEGNHRKLPWSGPAALTIAIGKTTTLRCQSQTPVSFARQIGFQDLRLYEIRRTQTGSAPADMRRSSLLSGTVFLDDLNAKAVTLRPFEDLSLEGSSGFIRAISVPETAPADNNVLRLQSHAVVRKMTRGAGANQRSLMPDRLEWLSAQTGIALLWTSIASVFGILYAVLRWLKIAS